MGTKYRANQSAFLISIFIVVLGLLVQALPSQGRPPIRRDFFDVYPSAETTRLGELPSNASHCGACHFDFDGGGARNPYGLAVEISINSGQHATRELAIAAVENDDSDNDGQSNLVEITDTINFNNTPTFPGLTASNLPSVSNVNVTELQGYLTPEGGSDTTPPVVTVTGLSGPVAPGTTQTVQWTAVDPSGISHVDIYLSDDSGSNFKQVAQLEPDDGMYDWFVPNLPGTQNVLRVAARDNAGNYGSGDSPGTFEVSAVTTGRVPTSLRDFDLPGSQPFFGAVLADPDQSCVTCHGNYDSVVEPWYNWKGSMMGQAMRDPVFLATLAVAEQDAPAVGDMCLRCHTPGGWLEGRSVDTLGGQLTAKDRQGVQCDFCHRLVDPIYTPGVSPAEDVAVLAALDNVPPAYANGEFVADPSPLRRGPYADAQASHQFLESPFHRESDLCGTCHDVSNPVFVPDGMGGYVPQALDEKHPDGHPQNMFPVERTYTEWALSEYAAIGVYAPEFAGSKPDGIVSSCQDCHMSDTVGKGSNVSGSPNRSDLPAHDLTGGNYFVADILPDFFPSEVDAGRLAAGKQRAIGMLQKAAGLTLTPGQVGLNPSVTVRVTNETGHKLPTGYPEGRRMWINVSAYDAQAAKVYESGAYDTGTGVLTHDPDARIYEIHPGISEDLAPVVGLPAGPSFHFALNNTVLFDNRIPPRGFDNAAFAAAGAAPVGHPYANGAHWDEASYVLPASATSVDVTLYYQSTSKEYIEFLRDENVTNSWGQDLYDAWAAHGKAAPIAMATESATVSVDPTAVDTPGLITSLENSRPNPFNASTRIHYSLATSDFVRVRIYDAAGRLVATLVDREMEQGRHWVDWQGQDSRGRSVGSGTYFAMLDTNGERLTTRMVLVK